MPRPDCESVADGRGCVPGFRRHVLLAPLTLRSFRGFVEVCVFAGLRLGEAAGLQLRDINFLGRSITVARQVQGSTIKAAKIVAPKYESERTVYVPDELITSLSAHVKRERITEADEQLFVTPLGRLWNRNNAAGEWRRIRDAVGLPDEVTIHTLRHVRVESHRAGLRRRHSAARSGGTQRPRSPSTCTATSGRPQRTGRAPPPHPS